MLRVLGITKRFGERQVLNRVRFDVASGEVYGLLGGNGAGKTTIVNIILRLLAPDSGTVSLNGEPLSGACKILGFAPQESAIYRDLTCEENLRLFGRIYGLRGPELDAAVGQVVDATGLREYSGARGGTLSGGWQRRLSLAIALVHSPHLLFLDEPTSGLDVEARHEVWRIIRGATDRGASVIITTHQMEEAEATCDRVGILVRGRIAAEGSLDELRTLVPAEELAEIAVEQEEALRTRTHTLGLEVREYAGRLTLLLPEKTTVSKLMQKLGEVGAKSITLRTVSLEHVYLEVLRQSGLASTA